MSMEKKPSIARKPIERKAVAAPAFQRDHGGALEPTILQAPTSFLSQPNDLPCELHGSPVPSRVDPKSSRSDAASGSSPPSLVPTSGPSQYAATVRMNLHADIHEMGETRESPGQNPVLATSTGSDVRYHARDKEEPSLATSQPRTNQARRMQRRTMMMSLTANIGTTQSQIEPASSNAPLPQPECDQPRAHARSSEYASPAKSLPRSEHSLQIHSPTTMAHATPEQPSSPNATQFQSGMFAQPYNSSVRPAVQVQNSARSSTPMQNSSSPRGPIPRVIQSNTTAIQVPLAARQNQAAQEPNVLTDHHIKPRPLAGSGSQAHSAFSPPLASSSTHNKPPNQRFVSAQSATTVSSANSLISGPNSASSAGSPTINASTPGTMYSPLSQSSASPPKQLASVPGIAMETSFFECLVCASGSEKVCFCIYCYTTGAAAGGHFHEPSYYICASDPLAPGSGIPPDIWTVRKNAMNRIWYQHNASQYKTYVRPQTATANQASGGWEERRHPQGKSYWFHADSGKSSWTKPGSILPSGWKEMKTPDGKSFYIHEEYRLSTWDCPGQQPGHKTNPQKNQQPSRKDNVAITPTMTQRNVAARRSSAAVAGVGVAAVLSTSAADIASDPIVGTTKAVTKGVMLAAKSWKNNKKARKMLSRVGLKGLRQITEAAINIEGDEDDFDLGDEDDIEDGGCGGEENGVEGYGSTGLGGSSNDYNAQDMNEYSQQGVPSDPCYVATHSPTRFTDQFMQQGSGFDSCGQVSNTPDCYQDAPPSAVENTNTVEDYGVSKNLTVQSVDDQATDQSNQDCHGENPNPEATDQITQSYFNQVNSHQVINEGNPNTFEQNDKSQITEAGTQNCADGDQYIVNTDAQQHEAVGANILNEQNETRDGCTNSQYISVSAWAPGSDLCAADTGPAISQSVSDPSPNRYLPSDVGQNGEVEQQTPVPFVFEPVLAAPMTTKPPAS